jgi:hypothetical protein
MVLSVSFYYEKGPTLFWSRPHLVDIEKSPMLQADAGTLTASACLALIVFDLRYRKRREEEAEANYQN